MSEMERQTVAAKLRQLNESFADMFHDLERARFGCQQGLSKYGMCERRVDHTGKHWREDCGMWWFDQHLGRWVSERDGVLP